MEDAPMMDPEDSLVTRRSRRSTAGNRMEAALAEMSIDDLVQEPEDDKDFFVEKYEEDMFESDFESTDEEAQEGDAGEQDVQNEEQQARKFARSRVERATAAAHARQKVTFNPGVEASSSTTQPKAKPKRRVQMGDAINAETGEVMDAEERRAASVKRKSQRKHTILNTSAHVKRMKKDKEKKAAQAPKRIRVESRTLTQAELIARALDNEEGNITSHRDYLKIEEEKRRLARVVRDTINGPVLRWVSKTEEIKVTVEAPAPPRPTYSYGYNGYGYGAYTPAAGGVASAYAQYAYTPGAPYFHTTPGVSVNVPTLPVASASLSSSAPTTLQTPASASTSTSNHYPSAIASTSQTSAPASASTSNHYPSATASTSQTTAPASASTSNHYPSATASTSQATAPASASTSNHYPSATASTSQTTASTSNNYPSATVSSSQITPTPSAPIPISNTNPYYQYLPIPPPPPPQMIERTEKVAKNYVVHELAQYEGAPKPPWADTMGAMFGEHVDWDEVRVYTGKARPLSRPRQMCPITGKQAKYLDPRTGVPFADKKGFETLTRVLKHDFVWSKELKCYVGEAKEAGFT